MSGAHFYVNARAPLGGMKSAVEIVAYREAELMHEWDQDGVLIRSSDYRPGQWRVDESLMVAPENAPGWAKELVERSTHDMRGAAQELAVRIDHIERRKDAQKWREHQITCPREMAPRQIRERLMPELAQAWAENGAIVHSTLHLYGKPNDASVPMPEGVTVVRHGDSVDDLGDHVRVLADGRWARYQPHIHQLSTMRPLTQGGFGNKRETVIDEKTGRKIDRKTTRLDDKATNEAFVREAHAICARHCADLGVDFQSKLDVQYEFKAEPKMGAGLEMEQRGAHSDAMEAHRAWQAEAVAKIEADPASVARDIAKNKATFTAKDIAYRLDKFGIKDRTEAIISALEEKGELVRLSGAVVDMQTGKEIEPARFAMPEQINVEANQIMTAMQLADRPTHVVFDEALERGIAEADAALKAKAGGGGLTTEQEKGIRHLTAPGQMKMLVGDAGTGKTTLVDGARRVWEGSGYEVRGTSFTARAARGLREAGISDSKTLAKFLGQFDTAEGVRDALTTGQDNDASRYALEAAVKRSQEKGAGEALTEARRAAIASGEYTPGMAKWRKETLERALKWAEKDLPGRKTIVVMDEAAMTNSKQMEAINRRADQYGFKLVKIGDHKQLQAIEAGAPFRAEVDFLGAARLSEIMRQRDAQHRAASMAFAEHDVAAGMAIYKAEGRVQFLETTAEARSAMLSQWNADRVADPCRTQVMLTYRNEDVRALNAGARERMIADGSITNQQTYKAAGGPTDLGVGDRVVFLRNNRGLDVDNGTTGTVIETAKGEFKVRIDGEDRTVTVNPKEYDQFAHGYAMTDYKAQGVTVDRAYFLASRLDDAHSTYVAETRHRFGVFTFASKEDFKAGYDQMVAHLSKARTQSSVLDYVDARAIEPKTVADFRVREYLQESRAAGRTFARCQEEAEAASIKIADAPSYADFKAAQDRRNALAASIAFDPDGREAALRAKVDEAKLDTHAAAFHKAQRAEGNAVQFPTAQEVAAQLTEGQKAAQRLAEAKAARVAGDQPHQAPTSPADAPAEQLTEGQKAAQRLAEVRAARQAREQTAQQPAPQAKPTASADRPAEVRTIQTRRNTVRVVKRPDAAMRQQIEAIKAKTAGVPEIAAYKAPRPDMDSMGRGLDERSVKAAVDANTRVQDVAGDLRASIRGAYRDPVEAEARLKGMIEQHGHDKAAELVRADASTLGELRGKVGLFGKPDMERIGAETSAGAVATRAENLGRTRDQVAADYRRDVAAQIKRDQITVPGLSPQATRVARDAMLARTDEDRARVAKTLEANPTIKAEIDARTSAFERRFGRVEDVQRQRAEKAKQSRRERVQAWGKAGKVNRARQAAHVLTRAGKTIAGTVAKTAAHQLVGAYVTAASQAVPGVGQVVAVAKAVKLAVTVGTSLAKGMSKGFRAK